MRTLIDSLIDNRGWAPTTAPGGELFSWTTALGLLTAASWVGDAAPNELAPPRADLMDVELANLIGDDSVHHIPLCPLNGSACSRRDEIDSMFGKDRVFVDIPYTADYRDFEKAICETLRRKGFEPVVAKNSTTSDVLLCKVCALIQTCGYGVADISKPSLNVPYELGFMHALGKQCAILKARQAKQPADIQGLEHIAYENTDELKGGLSKWIVENT